MESTSEIGIEEKILRYQKRLFIIFITSMVNILFREQMRPNDLMNTLKRMEEASQTKELVQQVKIYRSVFRHILAIYKREFYKLGAYDPPEFFIIEGDRDPCEERRGLAQQIWVCLEEGLIETM